MELYSTAKRKRAPRDLGIPKAATERPATRRKARRHVSTTPAHSFKNQFSTHLFLLLCWVATPCWHGSTNSRGEPCIVVVKGRQLNIDDAMGPSSSSGGGGGGAPSLYSLARLWIDNNTHTIHRPYLVLHPLVISFLAFIHSFISFIHSFFLGTLCLRVTNLKLSFLLSLFFPGKGARRPARPTPARPSYSSLCCAKSFAKAQTNNTIIWCKHRESPFVV